MSLRVGHWKKWTERKTNDAGHGSNAGSAAIDCGQLLLKWSLYHILHMQHTSHTNLATPQQHMLRRCYIFTQGVPAPNLRNVTQHLNITLWG